MKKTHIQAVLSLIVLGIGIYMLVTYDFPTPPAVSGLAFLLIGFSQWTNHCPICKKVLKK